MPETEWLALHDLRFPLRRGQPLFLHGRTAAWSAASITTHHQRRAWSVSSSFYGDWYAHFATVAEVLYLLLSRELKWTFPFDLLCLLLRCIFQYIDRLLSQIKLVFVTVLLKIRLDSHLLFDPLHALLCLERLLAAESGTVATEYGTLLAAECGTARLQLLLLLARSDFLRDCNLFQFLSVWDLIDWRSMHKRRWIALLLLLQHSLRYSWQLFIVYFWTFFATHWTMSVHVHLWGAAPVILLPALNLDEDFLIFFIYSQLIRFIICGSDRRVERDSLDGLCNERAVLSWRAYALRCVIQLWDIRFFIVKILCYGKDRELSARWWLSKLLCLNATIFTILVLFVLLVITWRLLRCLLLRRLEQDVVLLY